MQKTTILKPGEFERDWYVVDASGKTLGRLATRVEFVMMGLPSLRRSVEG